jgi:FolB domain-containing protein
MKNLDCRDAITLEQLKVSCILGVLPEERTTEQAVHLQVQLFLDLTPAAHSERLEDTVDYQLVMSQLVFLLRFGKFRLLETAAHVLALALLLPPTAGERRAAVQAVRLRIDKPLALSARATPSLTITRFAEDRRVVTEQKPFGTVDVIHETTHAGFYRLNVAPGLSIAPHVHQHMQEAEQVLSDGLFCQGEKACVGSVRRWPLGLVHRYDNPSGVVQSLLCIDCPPFVESDEIAADGPAAPWSPVSLWEG